MCHKQILANDSNVPIATIRERQLQDIVITRLSDNIKGCAAPFTPHLPRFPSAPWGSRIQNVEGMQ